MYNARNATPWNSISTLNLTMKVMWIIYQTSAWNVFSMGFTMKMFISYNKIKYTIKFQGYKRMIYDYPKWRVNQFNQHILMEKRV